MLREVGKQDGQLLRTFLTANASQMPRTMLRYSIEKFSELERRKWLSY
jgi:3-methyladenine DNA glycosylase AlkD